MKAATSANSRRGTAIAGTPRASARRSPKALLFDAMTQTISAGSPRSTPSKRFSRLVPLPESSTATRSRPGVDDLDLLIMAFQQGVLRPPHALMVDPQHFDRVRIVQDKGIDADGDLPRDEDGTKVFTDVLEAGPDSLFPLQGALGYDLHQTLFVGPNCLVVEGVSDLLYIQTVSAVLDASGRTGIDRRWTITPVGGSDKVPTFVALLGARKALGLATLIDFQKDDQQSIENLYKKRLLDKSRVLTYADFTGKKEADVEDMFDEEFYLRLVSEEFGITLSSSDIQSKHPRIVVRLEEHFASNPLPKGSKYNHYRPARLLAEKPTSLGLPPTTLDRFERAFTALNALLR